MLSKAYYVTMLLWANVCNTWLYPNYNNICLSFYFNNDIGSYYIIKNNVSNYYSNAQQTICLPIVTTYMYEV